MDQQGLATQGRSEAEALVGRVGRGTGHSPRAPSLAADDLTPLGGVLTPVSIMSWQSWGTSEAKAWGRSPETAKTRNDGGGWSGPLSQQFGRGW